MDGVALDNGMLLFFSKELKVARGTNLLHVRDRHTVILVSQLFSLSLTLPRLLDCNCCMALMTASKPATELRV